MKINKFGCMYRVLDENYLILGHLVKDFRNEDYIFSCSKYVKLTKEELCLIIDKLGEINGK